MKCPNCGGLKDKTIDSRESRGNEVCRRRKQCMDCGHRYTTYETISNTIYDPVSILGRVMGVNKILGDGFCALQGKVERFLRSEVEQDA
jgi:hypothetical protein